MFELHRSWSHVLFVAKFCTEVLTRIAGVETELNQVKRLQMQKPHDEFCSLLALAEQTPTSGPGTDRLLALKASLKWIIAINEHLQKRFLQVVVAENKTRAVEFARFCLRSLEETAAWVESNFS
jgi:hypothetical protein